MTWSGWSADFPQIEGVWRRAGRPAAALESFRCRHVDLYRSALSAIRLPLKSFGLSELAAYLDFEPRLPGVAGWQMPMLYRSYLQAKDEIGRQELKNKLLGHNDDDLRATWHTYRELSRLLCPSRSSAIAISAD